MVWINKRSFYMTTTAAELKDAVVSALTDSGRIEKINAEIRQEIFSLITGDYQKPIQNEITRENFIINDFGALILWNVLKRPNISEIIDPVEFEIDKIWTKNKKIIESSQLFIITNGHY